MVCELISAGTSIVIREKNLVLKLNGSTTLSKPACQVNTPDRAPGLNIILTSKAILGEVRLVRWVFDNKPGVLLKRSLYIGVGPVVHILSLNRQNRCC
jgi:hypothetical protein